MGLDQRTDVLSDWCDVGFLFAHKGVCEGAPPLWRWPSRCPSVYSRRHRCTRSLGNNLILSSQPTTDESAALIYRGCRWFIWIISRLDVGWDGVKLSLQSGGCAPLGGIDDDWFYISPPASTHFLIQAEERRQHNSNWWLPDTKPVVN